MLRPKIPCGLSTISSLRWTRGHLDFRRCRGPQRPSSTATKFGHCPPPLSLDERRFARLTWKRMSNSDPPMMTCPSCGGEMESAKKRCPHCGRPMGERGFIFYVFWVGLSLIVVGLVADIFYTAFLILNRML